MNMIMSDTSNRADNPAKAFGVSRASPYVVS